MSQTKALFSGLLILGAIIILFGTSIAQEMQTMIYDGDSMIMLPEIGCIIKIEDEKLIVQMKMDIDNASIKQADIDLQKNDVIAMMNGKRLKSKKDFDDLYGGIAEGEKVKMGVKRGQDMLIVSFDKPAPISSQIPGNKKIIMGGPSGGDTKAVFSQDGDNINLNLEGNIEGMLPILEIGMILGEDDGVKIMNLLPNFADIFPEGKFVVNDLISALNGTKIATTDEFQKAFSEISTGDDVTITMLRDGKTIEETFKKPKSKMKYIK